MNIFFIDEDIELIADPLSMKAYEDSLYDLNNMLVINLKFLTKKQNKRLYMKYYLNMSNIKIAKIENVMNFLFSFLLDFSILNSLNIPALENPACFIYFSIFS